MKKNTGFFEARVIEGDYSEMGKIRASTVKVDGKISIEDVVKNVAIDVSNNFKKPVTYYTDELEVFANDGDATVKERRKVLFTPTKKKEKRGIVFEPPGHPLRILGTYNPILKKFVGCDRWKEPDNINSSRIVTCFCGKEFETTNPKKIYCSQKCRENRSVKLGNVSRRVCPFCGEWYTPKQMRSQTCGKAKCRTRLSRREKSRKGKN